MEVEDFDSDTDMFDEDDAPSTQKAASSQDVLELDQTIQNYNANAFGQLVPLKPIVPAFDLYQASTVIGRGGGKYHVDVSFEAFKLQKSVYEMLSVKHCTIEHEAGVTKVVDTSTNGTFINGELIGKGMSQVVFHGDVLSFGKKDFGVFCYHEAGHKTIFPQELLQDYNPTEKLLGSGAWGFVIEAFTRNTCQPVAIKEIAKKLSILPLGTQSSSQMIKHEADIMLRINHPNCVGFKNFFDTPRAAYIVMELLRGGDLFTRLEAKHGKGFGEELSRFYAYQLLEAVEYLHARGITHRDIKLENILLVDNREFTVAKLADFGLSKFHGLESMRTFCGTPEYTAPEMIDLPFNSPSHHYTPKVDIWSLGVTLWTCICGYQPFSSHYDDNVSVKDQIRTARLIYFKEPWDHVSWQARLFIKMMLNISVENRVSAQMALQDAWLNPGHSMVQRAKNMVNNN